MKRGYFMNRVSKFIHVTLALMVLGVGFYLVTTHQPLITSSVIVKEDPYVYCIKSTGGDYFGITDKETCCDYVHHECTPLEGETKLRYNEGIFSYNADYLCFDGVDKSYLSEGVFRACLIFPD